MLQSQRPRFRWRQAHVTSQLIVMHLQQTTYNLYTRNAKVLGKRLVIRGGGQDAAHILLMALGIHRGVPTRVLKISIMAEVWKS